MLNDSNTTFRGSHLLQNMLIAWKEDRTVWMIQQIPRFAPVLSLYDEAGLTPLLWAAMLGFSKVVLLLLRMLPPAAIAARERHVHIFDASGAVRTKLAGEHPYLQEQGRDAAQLLSERIALGVCPRTNPQFELITATPDTEKTKNELKAAHSAAVAAICDAYKGELRSALPVDSVSADPFNVVCAFAEFSELL